MLVSQETTPMYIALIEVVANKVVTVQVDFVVLVNNMNAPQHRIISDEAK